jgi:hypothetical protein
MNERYRLSFTTGGLFIHESLLLADCYSNLGSWAKVREHVRQCKILQVRTATATIRISKEVCARLETLDLTELDSLRDLHHRDQAYLLWAATCRRYAFIRDFAMDVLREHHLLLRRQVTFVDYESFYNSKALWHAELDELAPSTQLKLRQNIFRMLREADLISDQHMIHPAQLSPQLAQILARGGRREFLIFPASANEIQRWVQ